MLFKLLGNETSELDQHYEIIEKISRYLITNFEYLFRISLQTQVYG